MTRGRHALPVPVVLARECEIGLQVLLDDLVEGGLLGLAAAVRGRIEAACRRLRAVLLTSLTTVAGLTPLLFETSFQAQFLIPMATSIAFGLAFATLLVLLLIPSLLSIHESAHARMQQLLGGRPASAASGRVD